jgi:hypothetical protein
MEVTLHAVDHLLLEDVKVEFRLVQQRFDVVSSLQLGVLVETLYMLKQQLQLLDALLGAFPDTGYLSRMGTSRMRSDTFRTQWSETLDVEAEVGVQFLVDGALNLALRWPLHTNI